MTYFKEDSGVEPERLDGDVASQELHPKAVEHTQVSLALLAQEIVAALQVHGVLSLAEIASLTGARRRDVSDLLEALLCTPLANVVSLVVARALALAVVGGVAGAGWDSSPGWWVRYD